MPCSWPTWKSQNWWVLIWWSRWLWQVTIKHLFSFPYLTVSVGVKSCACELPNTWGAPQECLGTDSTFLPHRGSYGPTDAEIVSKTLGDLTSRNIPFHAQITWANSSWMVMWDHYKKTLIGFSDGGRFCLWWRKTWVSKGPPFRGFWGHLEAVALRGHFPLA